MCGPTCSLSDCYHLGKGHQDYPKCKGCSNIEKCKRMSKANDPFGYVPIIIIFSTLAASLPLHEIGHGIALYLLGIPFTFSFEIRAFGLVLMTKWSHPPATIEDLAFAIILGPGFAAIVCAMLGRSWRTECYVAAAFQGCYVPFELSTWIFGVQSLDSLLIVPLFLICLVPCMIIIHKVFKRMQKEAER